ncbi:cellulose-binding domain-containing protein [Nocardia sp. NRRL S-836]|uniref:cellulose-binding domain-containing protein n=1 Tax=Nocardia sp. NRRL S-836 TaxID=1519492 RepID=UPI0012FAAD4C|nr:cellulose-binding domain-containing protein [Nocardia sp. NRRL S-836]
MNEQTASQGVLHFVRDVIDARTVELADGTTVRVARLAAPADCWAEAAVAFARTTLLATAVRVDFLDDGVKLVLEDGADYAQLAVRQGVLRAEGVDGGPLVAAESQAAAADLGLWGAPCNGLDLVPSPPALPVPAPPVPVATTPTPPAPPVVPPPRPAPPTTTVPARPPAPPARGCAVAYRITGQWPGGFQANVTVRNTGPQAVNGWTLRWTFANGQTVTGMWNATPRQTGATVNAANAAYNAQLPAGGSVLVGFNGSVRAANSAPGAFILNDETCMVE